MWRSPRRRTKRVTCVACGETVPRSGAREYDKFGDRWDRTGKDFEYLCKPCNRDLCHQPRNDLETLLTDVEGDDLSRDEFLARYVSAVEQRYGPVDQDDADG